MLREATNDRIVRRSERSASFYDGFPLTEGHLLVVPSRHVARIEALDRSEWQDLFELVGLHARELAQVPGVEGINLGVNSGSVAGQTIDHAHVHVIPRRPGDVDDPRGGVRWVVPRRADYWSAG